MQMSIPFYIGAHSHPLVPLAAERRTSMGVQRRRFLPVLVLGALLALGSIEGECVWSGASAISCSGFPPSNQTSKNISGWLYLIW